MAKAKQNHLLEAVASLFSEFPAGRVLDLGCGEGRYAKRLKSLGFEVFAIDADADKFKYREEIEFRHCDITKEIPFPDGFFDYVLLAEVLEHLRNPYEVFASINRVMKKGGSLVLSTPNILNVKSRYRFLLEGTYGYFREPPLDQAKNPEEALNLHLAPYRYHELEYLFFEAGFRIEKITTSIMENYWLWFLLPLIFLQTRYKQGRAAKKNGLDYSRINKVLLSKKLLFGRHLIVQAVKTGGFDIFTQDNFFKKGH